MYEWIKAFHLIAMVSWMAGLFYLPRLFVYHTLTSIGSDASNIFKTMERKLSLYIMTPAMIATWIFGLLLLALNPAWMQEDWMYLKLFAVLAMTVFHMATARWRKALAQDERVKSERFFRIANEAPTVLVVLVIIMASVKPF